MSKPKVEFTEGEKQGIILEDSGIYINLEQMVIKIPGWVKMGKLATLLKELREGVNIFSSQRKEI